MIEHTQTYFILATTFGFLMACAIGANDVANAMGTSVGAKILSLRSAIIIAAIFEALGALLASGHVTKTIGSSMIDIQLFADKPEILALGMIASLFASGAWLALATLFRWPVSTTHSIIGAITGFAVITMGIDSVQWTRISSIALSWVLTPLIAGLFGYVLFNIIEGTIFRAKNPTGRAKQTMPIYLFAVIMVITLTTLTQGLKTFDIHLTGLQAILIASAFSLAITVLSQTLWIPKKLSKHSDDHLKVENIFGTLAVFTACAMAFAHGSNDTANAIGPLSMVIGILHAGAIPTHTHLPLWIILLGASGIGLGLAVYGYRIIDTIGKNITHLTPSRGFVAQFATATTVIMSSAVGLPVSTTQVLVGAVLGVGAARGIDAINLTVVRNIFTSWIITLPAGALFSMGIFHVLRYLFQA